MAGKFKRGNGSVRFDAKSNCFVGRLSAIIDGQRCRPSVTGKTYTECSNALRRLQRQIESGELVAKRDSESVALYLLTWLDASSIETSTKSRYRSLLKKLDRLEWFAMMKLHAVTPMIILKLYKDLMAETDSTRRKVHVLLHSAFEDARHLRRIGSNPCDIPKKQKPKYKVPDVRPFTEKQEATFLTAIRDDEYEALFLLALDSGARQGELLALEWSDINFTTASIRIRKTLKDDGNQLVIGATKGKAERSITISITTLNAINRLRETKTSLSTLVFSNRDGGFISRQNFNRRHWTRIMQKAGLAECGFTFHDLRHSCATMLLRHGEAVNALAILRLAPPSTIMRTHCPKTMPVPLQLLKRVCKATKAKRTSLSPSFVSFLKVL